MRAPSYVLVASIWLASGVVTAPQAAGPQPQRAGSQGAPVSDFRSVVNQYCVTCHNTQSKTAGLALDSMDFANIQANAEVWEHVVRKLRTGAMPPQGVRRPDPATYEALLKWLEAELDRGAAGQPYQGQPLLHRLNRVEYANAIRDLLAVDVDAASLLPPDDSGYGFDNIADVLGVSSVLLERYVAAAGKISALALGDPEYEPRAETYLLRQDLSQDRHIEGLPLGTVGGTLVRHTFPLDGDYDFQAKLFRTNNGATRGLEYPHQLEITVDGERVFFGTVGGDADFRALFEDPISVPNLIDARLHARVRLKAGPKEVAITFLQKSLTVGTRRLRPFERSLADTYDFMGQPHINTLTITGPFNGTRPADTPSRRRILVCQPSSRSSEEACAAKIMATLARRAYRRPVTDEDLRPLLAFYRVGRREGSFEAGIQAGLERILASPKFVFRAERDPARVAPGTLYRISDVELASRLSFFLWSSIPDDELLELASQGRLKTPAVLARQVRRMLVDPRAQALVGNFAGQWLQLRNLRSVVPNSYEFPDFDDNLRQAFQRETELFVASIIHDDRNVLDLLSADYTFVNERLAKHYGIPNISGSQFRRVTITDEARKGLLGQGSILAVTSHAGRTSPVLRGKWILENLLGTPPPPPPPDVPALKDPEEGEKPRTMREQMAEHRANPVCAVCHKIMDPLGFALENFDAVGAWRAREAGAPIDASGEFVDGTKMDGVVTLRQTLLRRPEVLVGTLTEKLLTYALGRGLRYQDMPVVRKIVRESGRHEYQFSSLVLGIVTSGPFQMRMKASSQDQVAPLKIATVPQ